MQYTRKTRFLRRPRIGTHVEVLLKSSAYSAFGKYYATENKTLTICHARAGYAYVKPVIGWVVLLLHNGDLRRGDVLILNEDIHFRRLRQLDTELVRIEESLLSNQELQALRDLCFHLF